MKLTLREIFVLTLVVALMLGWWLDRRRFAQTPALPADGQPGRWQIVVGSDQNETLLDTTTGDTWRYNNYAWQLRPAPKR